MDEKFFFDAMQAVGLDVVVWDMASKAYAEYQTEPKGSEQCDKCTMFRPPSKCTYVDGKISPQGWCNHFERK